jgi:hypothetical protein
MAALYDRNKLIFLCDKFAMYDEMDLLNYISRFRQDISDAMHKSIYNAVCNVVQAEEKKQVLITALRLEVDILNDVFEVAFKDVEPIDLFKTIRKEL